MDIFLKHHTLLPPLPFPQPPSEKNVLHTAARIIWSLWNHSSAQIHPMTPVLLSKSQNPNNSQKAHHTHDLLFSDSFCASFLRAHYIPVTLEQVTMHPFTWGHVHFLSHLHSQMAKKQDMPVPSLPYSDAISSMRGNLYLKLQASSLPASLSCLFSLVLNTIYVCMHVHTYSDTNLFSMWELCGQGFLSYSQLNHQHLGQAYT